jgi:hypothetical protein
MNITGLFERRSVLKAGALLGGLSALLARAQATDAAERDGSDGEAVADEVKMAEIPLSPAAKVTVERRGDRHQSALHPQPNRSRNICRARQGVLPIRP